MEKVKKWKPKTGAKYYSIGSGHILKGVHKEVWTGSEANESQYSQGNCFRSKREAEFVYKSFNGAF